MPASGLGSSAQVCRNLFCSATEYAAPHRQAASHKNCSMRRANRWQAAVGARIFQSGRPRVVLHRGRPIMVESLVAWLDVGAIAGWLAGLIVKGFGFGLVGNIVVGIIGAVIAGWLLPRLGIGLGIGLGVGMVAAIINAVIGAVVLLVIIGLVRRAT